jgi:hypothetical protein
MTRYRFTDSAGYMHHCWECEHAKGWYQHKTTFGGSTATCELTGMTVGKYDSPDNPYSRIPDGCDWSEA